MKFYKKVIPVLMIVTIVLSSIIVSANNENNIISIGADLTDVQKEQMLNELGYTDDMSVIEVTNAEEYKYLGGIIPDEKIGTTALSNARIDFLDKNEGLIIEVSDNINYINEDVFYSALSTAGITDARVQVTAPMSVTGTGALTGIMKAYEISTGEVIEEDVKHVATEEMITTAELMESIDEQEVSELIDTIKITIDQNMPESRSEARQLVIDVSNELNITLTDNQVEKLTDLIMKMKDANIDWDVIKDNVAKHGKAVQEYLSSEEGKSLLQTIKNIFVSIIDWITDFF